MNKTLLRAACASLAVTAGLISQQAGAQDATDEPVAVAQDDREILVTAQKREENLQDVPVSISVVEGEELVKSGSSQLTDFAPYVPGFREFEAHGR
jgi:outer membrane receptor protein involved in Fe transport